MDIATGMQKARRVVASLSVVTLLASFFVGNVAQAAATYTDVPADAWFYTYVEQLAAAGILDTTQTMYRPADLANRAEAAKLLVAASGLTIDTSAGPSFTDVAPGAWYYQYVETAAKNGIVSGYKDAAGNLTGKFGPGDSVTREQFAKMAVNAETLTTDTDGGPHFPDVGTDRWSYSFIETLYNNSVVDGYPDGSFKPENNINRAEIAKMVVGAMNPVPRGTSGAYNVQAATATSATMVNVEFSMDVDPTAGAMASNYTITDPSGNPLNVTAATVSGSTVTLTTASQTDGKLYTLWVANVPSADGAKPLDNGKTTFSGFSVLGVGGALTVSLSPSPDVTKQQAVPAGASGVNAACWTFTAGSDAAVVTGLTVKLSKGSRTAFQNVYLYSNGVRLTTGRTINSDNMVDFSGINQSVVAGGSNNICLVADIVGNTTNLVSVNTFELTSMASVTSNASSISGSFPLVGPEMLITNTTTGSVKITNNGVLDQVVVGQKDARIAQFQLEAGSVEDISISRIALYVSGSINNSELTNMRLYSESPSGDVLVGTAASVGSRSLVTFNFTTPIVIKQGQRTVFHVLSDLSTGRNGDTIQMYLDESSDLLAVGNNTGYGVPVTFTGYNGSVGNMSQVTVIGSKFIVQPVTMTQSDIAIGSNQVHCLDLTISNQNGADVDIRNWETVLGIQNVPAVNGANGLINGTPGGSATPNYKNIKLVKIDSNGNITDTLLDGADVKTDAAANDQTQTVVLSGDRTIKAGETFNAAVIFDLASNAAMGGDQINCKLTNLTTAGKKFVQDINGKELDGQSITPSSDIIGKVFNVTSSALTLNINNTPTSKPLPRGTTNAQLFGLSITAGNSLNVTVKSLSLTAYVDQNGDGTFGVGTETFLGNTAKASDIVPNGVALYAMDGAGNPTVALTSVKSINSTTGVVTFFSGDFLSPWAIMKAQTANVVLVGSISNGAPIPSGFTGQNKIKFAVVNPATDISVVDQNNQTVDTSAAVTNNATNGGTTGGTVVMTITSGGQGTVATSSVNQTYVAAASKTFETSEFKFTSQDEQAVLQDLELEVLNDNSSSVSSVKLFNKVGGVCTTQVGSTQFPDSTGRVKFQNLGVSLSTTADTILCAQVQTNAVTGANTPPFSGANVGLALLNVTKVNSASGANIVQRYAGTPFTPTANVLTAAMDPACTVFGVACGGTLATAPAVGDVIIVDSEMMLVTVAGVNPTVVRGFADTTATAHNSGVAVNRSTVAKAITSTAAVLSTTATNNVGVNADTITFAAAVPLVAGDTLVVLPSATGAVVVPGYYTVNANAAGVVTLNDNAGVSPVTTTGAYTVLALPTAAIAGAIKGDIIATGTNMYLVCLKATCTDAAPLPFGVVGAGNFISTFTIHGPMSKLYRSVPVVAPNFTALQQSGGALGNGNTLADFTITPDNSSVNFNLGGTDGNKIVMNYSFSTGGSMAGATCLLNQDGGSLVATALPADIVGTSTGTITFSNTTPGNFPPYSISAGTTQSFNVQCTGMTLTPTAPATSTSLLMSFNTASNPVQWNDGVQTTIIDAASALFPSNMNLQSTHS